jgi:very-short-patch-repair endonuclease
VWLDKDAWLQRLWAALLWLGPTAVASHRTAAALFNLDGFKRGPIEITVTNGRAKTSDVAVIHRSRGWNSGEVGTLNGIPVTSVPRTIMDLAAVCPYDDVEAAMESALRRDRDLLKRLRKQITLRNGRGNRGVDALRRLVADHDGTPTGSPLELEFERFCRARGLPRPVRQFPIYDGDHFVARVDFAYPTERVIIEVESFEWHTRRRKWDSDVDRFNTFRALDWEPLRVTSTKMREEPGALACLIRSALDAGANRLL